MHLHLSTRRPQHSKRGSSGSWNLGGKVTCARLGRACAILGWACAILGRAWLGLGRGGDLGELRAKLRDALRLWEGLDELGGGDELLLDLAL
eukprot:2731314-Prymnesium_polylepis.1